MGRWMGQGWSWDPVASAGRIAELSDFDCAGVAFADMRAEPQSWLVAVPIGTVVAAMKTGSRGFAVVAPCLSEIVIAAACFAISRSQWEERIAREDNHPVLAHAVVSLLGYLELGRLKKLLARLLILELGEHGALEACHCQWVETGD